MAFQVVKRGWSAVVVIKGRWVGGFESGVLGMERPERWNGDAEVVVVVDVILLAGFWRVDEKGASARKHATVLMLILKMRFQDYPY
jgi:hypothetical protein